MKKYIFDLVCVPCTLAMTFREPAKVRVESQLYYLQHMNTYCLIIRPLHKQASLKLNPPLSHGGEGFASIFHKVLLDPSSWTILKITAHDKNLHAVPIQISTAHLVFLDLFVLLVNSVLYIPLSADLCSVTALCLAIRLLCWRGTTPTPTVPNEEWPAVDSGWRDGFCLQTSPSTDWLLMDSACSLQKISKQLDSRGCRDINPEIYDSWNMTAPALRNTHRLVRRSRLICACHPLCIQHVCNFIATVVDSAPGSIESILMTKALKGDFYSWICLMFRLFMSV